MMMWSRSEVWGGVGGSVVQGWGGFKGERQYYEGDAMAGGSQWS